MFLQKDENEISCCKRSTLNIVEKSFLSIRYFFVSLQKRQHMNKRKKKKKRTKSLRKKNNRRKKSVLIISKDNSNADGTIQLNNTYINFTGKDLGSEKREKLKIVLTVIGIIVPVLMAILSNTTCSNSTTKFPDEERIQTLIEDYRTITNSSNYIECRKLYSPIVERYYNSYNIDIDSVVKLHKSYNRKFGVRGKISNIYEESLVINKTNNNKVEVSFNEDFLLDRDDTTKNTMFLLKKYFVVDNEYKIVCEYEEIIKEW